LGGAAEYGVAWRLLLAIKYCIPAQEFVSVWAELIHNGALLRKAFKKGKHKAFKNAFLRRHILLQ